MAELRAKIQAALNSGDIVGFVSFSDGQTLSANGKPRKGVTQSDHSVFAPSQAGQNGQPSPEPPPIPEGFTLPSYAASMPNARGLIKLACVESRRNGNAKHTAVYWGLQDVLEDFADYLSEEAQFSLIANFGNARMKLGPLFGTRPDLVGATWRTYPLDKPSAGAVAHGHAYVQTGQPYSDALTFCDDQQTHGTHASDLEAWAAYNDANGWPLVV